MAEQQDNSMQYLFADFNTRLRDLEERNRVIRERVLLLGKNLISSKTGFDEEIDNLKRQSREFEKDIKKIRELSQSIVHEMNKFVKRNEMVLIEKMLKDFQPLEFLRKKDIEELIDEKIKQNINSIKSKK